MVHIVIAPQPASLADESEWRDVVRLQIPPYRPTLRDRLANAVRRRLPKLARR